MLGNAVGVAAAIVFLIAWLGAVGWWIARLGPRMREFNEAGMGVWKDADLRGRFLPFLGFCALGVVAGLVGFAFGGWPTD